MEMIFFRSMKSSRLDKNINNIIREKINVTNSMLDYIYKQLNWYGHVPKMNEERIPPNLQLCTPRRRRRNRRRKGGP